jgi:hypothetical protein
MTTEITLYIIENNQILDYFYLGGGSVLEYFLKGNYSMKGFKRLVDRFISDIEKGMVTGYVDSWINNGILRNPSLKEEMFNTINSHPTANFQILWE